MKLKEIKNWSAEKISLRIFFVLTGFSVLLFLLFFLVGFDLPYIFDPDFNAPLFTDPLLIFMELLLFAALAITGYSVWRGHKCSPTTEKVVNNVPAAKISRITWIGTFACLAITFGIGSTATMVINGRNFEDTLWLRLSDMFVWTSLILLAIAIATVCYGGTKYIRKSKERRKR